MKTPSINIKVLKKTAKRHGSNSGYIKKRNFLSNPIFKKEKNCNRANIDNHRASYSMKTTKFKQKRNNSNTNPRHLLVHGRWHVV